MTSDSGAEAQGGGGEQQAQGGGGQARGQDDAPWKAEFGDNFDPAKAWEALTAARGESRQHRNRLTKAEQALKDREDAEKSDLEKATAKASELERELNTYREREKRGRTREIVTEAGRKANAIYPEDLYSLLSDDLEIEDDGTPKGLDSAIRRLREARPVLFRSGNGADAGARTRETGGANSNSDINDAIRRSAGVRV